MFRTGCKCNLMFVEVSFAAGLYDISHNAVHHARETLAAVLDPPWNLQGLAELAMPKALYRLQLDIDMRWHCHLGLQLSLLVDRSNPVKVRSSSLYRHIVATIQPDDAIDDHYGLISVAKRGDWFIRVDDIIEMLKAEFPALPKGSGDVDGHDPKASNGVRAKVKAATGLDLPEPDELEYWGE